MTTENRVVLCSLDELEDGSSRGFRLQSPDRDAIFLVRRGDKIRAYQNWCPHQGATLPWKKDAYLNADKDRIVCFAHGAEFDIDTGQCVSGAALGQCLRPVEIIIDEQGLILACLAD